MVLFRDVKEEDVAVLLRDIHPIQILEVQASHGDDLQGIITSTVNKSREAFVAEDEGKMLALFGIVADSLLSDKASPWMLSTMHLIPHARTLIVKSRETVNRWAKEYSRLHNYIDARYPQSVNWARKIGFTVYDPVPYGVLQMPFHRIEKIGV